MDLNKEGYVQVALRVDDVQRWWDGEKGKNEFLGLHVQALYKNENLAVHPQPDLKVRFSREIQTLNSSTHF